MEPSSRNKDTLPVVLLNKALQTYLREARHTFGLQVQKCVLRKEGIEHKFIEETVYFTESVLLGMFVDAEAIRNEKSGEQHAGKEDKYYTKEIVEIIASKIRKVEHLSLSIEMDCMDTIDNCITARREKFIKVDDIQICNTPREYFLGKKPQPSSPLMEMTMLTSNNGKLFQK